MSEITKNLSPKRMTEVIKETRMALRKAVLKDNFLGHHIQVSGRIHDADAIGYDYVSFYIEDQDGVTIALNFDIPPKPGVATLKVGDSVVARGEIFNVSDSMVVLRHCVLTSGSESETEKVIDKKEGLTKGKSKKWFSMNNPLVWIIFTIVAGTILVAIKFFFFPAQP